MRSCWSVILALCFLLTACQNLPGQVSTAPAPALSPHPSPSPSTSPSPSPIPTRPAASPEPAAVLELQVCSPLEGVALQQLQERIVNPFHPPPPGSDDPHQGVDFAELSTGDPIALEGLPVHAVLSGRVASVVIDRFPYGNALLVETPLEDLSSSWRAQLQVPTPGPTLELRSALTCPPERMPSGESEGRSLYLLYAHMKEPVDLQTGKDVACGENIGAIGSSGNALNPHLHLEIRVGPSGANFSSMAHYESNASLEEMANYCVWRVSGIFQLIDPLRLLSLAP